ncbi:MAG TPA: Ig-like domain-containing protein [Longimicrobium sp.]|nr:Ig-like domain-containing protein [Longimicrobium sp.]
MHSRHIHTPWAGALALVALFAGCGGGGAASTPVEPGSGGAQALVTRVTVDPPAASVAAGGTIQLTATPMDAAGAPVPGTEAATWSSSAPGVARVSATGLVTAVAAGSASVTASIVASGTPRSASAQVTVTAAGTGQPPSPTFTSLSLTPGSGGVAVGATLSLTATPLGASGEALAGLPAATFTSSNPSIASVNGSGLVTGVSAGSVVVTASLTAGGVTRSATATVAVTASPGTSPGSVTVRGLEHAFSPASVTISVGGTVTWTMVDDEHDVTWTGAAPAGGNIPKMDRGESVSRTFATAGSYNYRCVRHENHNETGTVIVQAGTTTPPPPTQQPVFTSLTLTPATPSVAVGATVQLAATPRDQNGQPMAGLPAAVFTSSTPTVATVNGSGVVTGVAQGTSTITATLISGGVSRTANTTVMVTAGGTTPPPPPPTTTVTVTTPGSSFAPPRPTRPRSRTP